jgi:hypothetical protein
VCSLTATTAGAGDSSEVDAAASVQQLHQSSATAQHSCYRVYQGYCERELALTRSLGA